MIFDHQARIIVSFDAEKEMVTVRDVGDVQKRTQISFKDAMPINISTMKGVLSLDEWWSRQLRK